MPPLTTRILVGPTRSRTWPMAVTALAVRLELSELSALLALLSAEVPGWALAVWLAPEVVVPVPEVVVPVPAGVPLALGEPVEPLGSDPTAETAEAVGAPPALKFGPAAALTGVPIAAGAAAEPMAVLTPAALILALAPVAPARLATGSWTGM